MPPMAFMSAAERYDPMPLAMCCAGNQLACHTHRLRVDKDGSLIAACGPLCFALLTRLPIADKVLYWKGRLVRPNLLFLRMQLTQ